MCTACLGPMGAGVGYNISPSTGTDFVRQALSRVDCGAIMQVACMHDWVQGRGLDFALLVAIHIRVDTSYTRLASRKWVVYLLQS